MKESIFSFFNAPITNQVPNGVVCVSQLHAYITTSEWLRERTDQVRAASSDEKRFRRLKQSLLPYVTPAGIFSYRKEDHLLVPSGEFVIDIDMLVVAAGSKTNPLIAKTTPDLEVTPRSLIVADDDTGATSKPGVFAGGDAVIGAATVILAMGAGKRAAAGIAEYLTQD